MKIFSSSRLPVLTALALLVSTPQSWALFDAGSNAFANASVIPNDGRETISTATNLLNFTEEPGEESHNPSSSLSAGNTAWWTWTAPDDGYCTVDTLRTASTSEALKATIMSVYTGDSLNSLQLVSGGAGYSDNNASPLSTLSQIIFYAVKGTKYRIAVDAPADSFISPTTSKVMLQLRLLALKKTSRVTAFSTADEFALLTLEMTATGSLSGKLTLGSKSYPFKGLFGADGYYTAVIPQKGVPGALPLNLQIDGTGKGYVVFSVNGTNVAYSPFPRKLVFNAQTPNSTTNSYTAHMLRTGGDNPRGEGSFTVKVSATGAVTGTGNAPDGTAVTFGAALSEGNQPDTYYIIAYKSLHAGKGGFALAALLQENGAIDRLVSGGGLYKRPAKPAATFYPAGLNMIFSLEGSTYTKPLVGKRALDFLDLTGDGTLDITDANGELGGNIAEALNLSIKNKFTFSSATRKPVLTLNATTGVVTGSITAPPAKKRTIKGVLVRLLGVPTIRGYVTGSSTNLFFEVTP